MRVIDARSGKEFHEGEQVAWNGDKGFVLHKIVEKGFLKADAYIIREDEKRLRLEIMPLTVRILHPNYLFQRVAFIPS